VGAGDKNGLTKYTTRKENKAMLEASFCLMEVDTSIMQKPILKCWKHFNFFKNLHACVFYILESFSEEKTM
jgi:hypothetical protein